MMIFLALASVTGTFTVHSRQATDFKTFNGVGLIGTLFFFLCSFFE
jgi:hypothetical protein